MVQRPAAAAPQARPHPAAERRQRPGPREACAITRTLGQRDRAIFPRDSQPAAAARHSGWEHGLLTPEELRALLQDPDDTAGPQEAQP